MKIAIKKVMVLALAATFLGTSISSLADEVESRKLSIIRVIGDDAKVIKNHNRNVPAAEGMNLGQGNSVKTGKVSNVYIEADDDKIVKLDENTLVEITKASAKSLKLTLENGKLFFNVEKPLAEDEELTFDAAQTSMSIRGTSGFWTMDAQTLRFRLVDGKVDWDLGDQILQVNAGQQVELERDWSGQKPGPGADKIYRLRQIREYDWTELEADELELVLMNRDTINSSAIGLTDSTQINQALNKLTQEKERIRLEKEEEERRYQEYLMSLEEDEDDEDETPAAGGSAGETESSAAAASSSAAESSGSSEEESTSAAESSGSGSEEESTESLIPADKVQGVDGDLLWNSDGEQVWVDYIDEGDAANRYFNATTSSWEWNEEVLRQDDYYVENPTLNPTP